MKSLEIASPVVKFPNSMEKFNRYFFAQIKIRNFYKSHLSKRVIGLYFFQIGKFIEEVQTGF